jgi:hypothetical protein
MSQVDPVGRKHGSRVDPPARGGEVHVRTLAKKSPAGAGLSRVVWTNARSAYLAAAGRA